MIRIPKRFAFFCTGILALAVAAACGDSQRAKVSEGLERIGSTSSALLSSAWTATVSMNVARQNHVAALLKNGSVLVAGGHPGNNVPTSSAEVYSPATGAWTTVGSMGTARRLFGACTLASGKVLVVGGNAGLGDVTSAELFDSSTKTWSATGSLAAAREDFSTTCLSDGRVLVVGGSGPAGLLASAEVYNPASGTWSSAGTLPAAVHTQRAVLLQDGRVLIAGGNNASGPVNTAAIWSPSTNAWTATGSMATSRSFNALNLLADGRVLAAGGLVNVLLVTTNKAEIYSPTAGTWSAAANLNTARYSGVSATLAAGPIVIGGVNGGSPLASSEFYDSVHNTWTQAATAYGAVNQTATALSPTSVIVAGGNTGSSATNSAQMYGVLNVFALYAQRSVTLGSSDHINGGDVGVAAPAAPGFGPQLVVGSSATVQTNHNLVAPSVSLGSGAHVGDVQTNSLTNSGGTLGTLASYPAMPAPPLALPTGSGGSNVTVPALTITTLNPGNYGAVSVTGTLYLNAGSYTFSSVTMAPQAHLAGVSGTATVSVAGTFQAGSSVSISSPGFTPAGQLVISVAGSDSGATQAFSVGTGAAISAILSAPHGTLSLGNSTIATGAFAGFDVTLGTGVTINFQNGFTQSGPFPCFGQADGTACGVAGNICASGSCIGQATAIFTPSSADPLPAPPTDMGCYIGTVNGWTTVPCAKPSDIISGFRNFQIGDDGVTTVPQPFSGGTSVPLVYGQVESTVIAVGSEASNQTSNQWSVQNNTNNFPCNSGSGNCGVQFTIATDGVAGHTAVCVSSVNVTSRPQVYTYSCVGANGQTVTINGGQSAAISTRVGPLQPYDFANVAGFAFTQPSGTNAIAMVAQFSWVSSQDVVATSETDVPNRIPGLYAVVAPDLYGLAGAWTDVTGGILGIDNGATANFMNAEVLTRVAASNCPGDVSASGPTCSGKPALSSSDVNFTVSLNSTVESDNLTLVQPPAVTFPNANLAVTEVLGSTGPGSGSFSTCLSSAPNHLFIKDNEGDIGGVPSNVGGVPFWESPDIFVVPQNAPAPGVNDVAADLELTANAAYDVYLRVHNDFGCSAVTGPINVFIDGADPNLGLANWLQVTPNAGSGQYTAFGSLGSVIVPAFGAAILGPFPWTPGDGGHKCLLAAIAADSETEPPTSTQPGHAVLPPAYGSNQIAQRNIQIGSSCTYSISNTGAASANLSLGLSVTPAVPAPGSSGGPTISLTFADPSSAFFNQWNGQAGISVSNGGGSTTVTLNSSYVALHTVPLPSGQSPSVSININPGNAAVPSVDVSAILTDPMTGNILQQNGGTCASAGVSTVIR